MRTLLFAMAIPALAASVAGLKWTAPSTWKVEAARPMRAATYTLPLSFGDAGSAECAVYFFGAGQGGSVEANLDRWKGQILGPTGKPADAQIQKRTIHSLPVTTIDPTGSYAGIGETKRRLRITVCWARSCKVPEATFFRQMHRAGESH